MDHESLERVRDVVAAIPAGCVLAYGDVAARAGLPGRARLVGRILAEDSDDLPWHRVLRADGSPAPHLAVEQLKRLRSEGVLADNGRVPMHRYRASCLRQNPGPELQQGSISLYSARDPSRCTSGRKSP